MGYHRQPAGPSDKVSDSDPELSKLAEAVVSQAMTDCARFRASSQALELTLPMPTQTLEDPELLNASAWNSPMTACLRN